MAELELRGHAQLRDIIAIFSALPGDWELIAEDTPEARACLNGIPVAPSADVPTRRVQGLDIVIDRPVGFVHSGRSESGNPWERTYQCDYGYIPHVDGSDGDDLDVYIGATPESDKAWLIWQKRGDGSFDEFKLMLGFCSEDEAKAAYLLHTPEEFFDRISPITIDSVRELEALASLERAQKASTPVRTLKVSADDSQHYVLGVVLEPDVIDSQNDTYSAEEIRSAAEQFLVEYRNIGHMHKGLINEKVRLVESYLAPEDLTIAGQPVRAGTWLIGCRIDDPGLWASVKNGEITGFSIGGSAIRKPTTAPVPM